MVVETLKNSKKEKRTTIAICDELKEILNKIRENVSYSTWGVEDNLSYFKATKILAIKIKKANIY